MQIMATITDEQMQQMLMQTREYTLVLLKANPAYQKKGIKKIIWEHGRRNFQLRAQGVLAIVAPVTAEHEVSRIYIFNTDAEKATALMKDDPAVLKGIFTYEVMPIRSFRGDSLPS